MFTHQSQIFQSEKQVGYWGEKGFEFLKPDSIDKVPTSSSQGIQSLVYKKQIFQTQKKKLQPLFSLCYLFQIYKKMLRAEKLFANFHGFYTVSMENHKVLFMICRHFLVQQNNEILRIRRRTRNFKVK